MKKNGYTIIELLIVIVVLGVITAVILTKTSYAFKDNKQEYYEQKISLALRQAETYAPNIENIKTTETVIMISELIEKGYLAGDADGNYIDPRNNEDISNLKIRITYNEENDSYDVKMAD